MMYWNDYSPVYSPFAHGFFAAFLPLIAVAIIWTIVLKGFALWYAARGSQKWWFVILLVVNTLGIVEIVYLIWFRPSSDDTHDRSSRNHSHHDHAAHNSSAQA